MFENSKADTQGSVNMAGGGGSSAPVCWVVTDGKPGVENQCLGLAEALNLTIVIKRIRLKSPWRQTVPFLRVGLACAFDKSGDELTPPWPDVLIASGRASIPASLFVRAASRKSGGRPTFTVQIQNPVIDASRFDLVVTPRHDGLLGDNVMSTRGSLHRVTPLLLLKEAEKFESHFSKMPFPRVSVLIGGSNSVYTMTPELTRNMTSQLADMARGGAGVMITASRRTGAENARILKDGLQGTSAYIWDGQGENPYYAMLGMADYIIVTCDSVNMISEACSTGKPVMVLDMPGGSEKFRRFHQAMRDDGMTRPFNGKLENWCYTALDDVRLVALRVKEMMGR